MRATRRGALAPVMVAALFGAASVVAAAPALATPGRQSGASSADTAGGPPGSNGTIKIDEIPVDSGMDNDPHVGCAFTVRFFGFDGGAETGRLVFDGKPPTGGGTLLDTTSSWTGPARTGGTTLDHEQAVDLTQAIGAAGLTPATQGYHVAVTAMVTEPNGRTVTKHKVFWVGPCGSSSAAPGAVAGSEAERGSEGSAPAGGTPVAGATGGMPAGVTPSPLPAPIPAGTFTAAASFATGEAMATMGLPVGVTTGFAGAMPTLGAPAVGEASVSTAGVSAAGLENGATSSTNRNAAVTHPASAAATAPEATVGASSGGGLLAGPRVLAAEISRVAALPFTGAWTWWEMAAALLLVAAGGALVLAARRRGTA